MNIWETIILEFHAEGPGRDAAYPYKPSNFMSFEKGEEWPYEDDDMMNYGVPSGPRGLDRGTRPGTDVSGGPPTPSSVYMKTWQDMHEAQGMPSRIGPFAPFDGPSMHSGRDGRPVLDVDGNPVSDQQIQPVVDPKIGPNNMWGGAGTIPGQDRGFGAAPNMGSDDPEEMKWKPPEDKKMNLREFFNPEAPPSEEVENPEQNHEQDQTDNDLEDQFGADEETPDRDDSSSDEAGVVMMDDEPAGIVSLDGGSQFEKDDESQEEGPEEESPMAAPKIDGAEAFQLTVEPEAGEQPSLSQMMNPQDNLMGQKVGPNDIMAMQQKAQSLIPQKSTWDDIAIQVGDAIINLKKSQPAPQMPPMMEKRRKGKI